MPTTLRRPSRPSPFPVIAFGVLWFLSTAALVVTIMEFGNLRGFILYGHSSHADCPYDPVRFDPAKERAGYVELLHRRDTMVREKEEKLYDLKEITGLGDPKEIEELVKQYSDQLAGLETKLEAPPGDSPTLAAVVRRWEALADFLQRKADEARQSAERANELRRQEVSAAELKVTTLQKTINEQSAKLRSLSSEIDATRRQYKEQMAEAQTRIRQIEEKFASAIKEKQDKIQNLQEEIKKLKQAGEATVTIAEAKSETAPPLVEGKTARQLPDGKVIYVDPDYQFVMLDIGRKDWLGLGTVFDVFYYKGDERIVKGQVRVKRVYDQVSYAVILHPGKKGTEAGRDLIVQGDLVSNPVFRRGTKPLFIAPSKYSNPRLERAIERFGGRLLRSDTILPGADYAIQPDTQSPESTKLVQEALKHNVRIEKESELLFYLEGERSLLQ